jgi:hypothetical protein
MGMDSSAHWGARQGLFSYVLESREASVPVLECRFFVTKEDA